MFIIEISFQNPATVPKSPNTSTLMMTFQPGHWVAKSAANSQYLLFFSLSRFKSRGYQAHATSHIIMLLLSRNSTTRSGRRSVMERSVGMLKSTASFTSLLSMMPTPFHPPVFHLKESGNSRSYLLQNPIRS